MNSTLQFVDNNLDQSMVNASPDTFNSPTPTIKVKSAYLTASKTSIDDTPRRSFLTYGIRQLSKEIQIKNSKLKKLQQTIRRQDKKIATMSEIIKNLKNKNLLNENDYDVLFESFGKHVNLITNWSKKSLGEKVPKKYSPAIRQFALSLHFFSPKKLTNMLENNLIQFYHIHALWENGIHV